MKTRKERLNNFIRYRKLRKFFYKSPTPPKQDLTKKEKSILITRKLKNLNLKIKV